MFQVVCIDNYDRDYISDQVIASGIVQESEARKMADELNAKTPRHSEDYYVVKPSSYVPRNFEP